MDNEIVPDKHDVRSSVQSELRPSDWLELERLLLKNVTSDFSKADLENIIRDVSCRKLNSLTREITEFRMSTTQPVE